LTRGVSLLADVSDLRFFRARALLHPQIAFTGLSTLACSGQIRDMITDCDIYGELVLEIERYVGNLGVHLLYG